MKHSPYLNNKLFFLKMALINFKLEISTTTKVSGFTQKDYFYFLYDENYKYIYKDALNYYYDIMGPFNQIEYLRNNNNFLLDKPLWETEHFLVFPYITGTILSGLSKSDIHYIIENYTKESLECWDNSLTYNLVRTKDNKIKLIDYKHLYPTNNKPYVYMYNKKHNINKFYELAVLSDYELELIKSELINDYPEINKMEYIRLGYDFR